MYGITIKGNKRLITECINCLN